LSGFLAGVFDPARPPGPRELTAALDGVAGTVRAESSGPLALAWEGPDAHTADGTLCVLDGRVANLADLGPPGEPATVVAGAYRRLGEDVVEHLVGEYAVLLWDRAAGRGLLARDRLGARPLFLFERGSRLWFASEVRTLLELLPERPAPDPAAVVHWLVGGGLRDGRTLYEGIVALPPASSLRLAGTGVEAHRYWSPGFTGTFDEAKDELVARLREELSASVRRCLDGYERAGILLSGGLDSASVAGVAMRDAHEGRTPSAYSAVFPGHPSTDESALIDLVTTELGMPGVRIAVHGGSIVAGALEYVRTWQLPLMDQNNFFMQPLLRRAAADGLEAVVDGEGGDELFGAARGLIADRVRRGRLLAAIGQTARLPGAGGRPPLRPLARLVLSHGLAAALPNPLHHAWRRAHPATARAPSWFRREAARMLVESDDSLAWKRLAGPRWWAQIADSLTAGIAARGVHDHARRRAAMAGLEAGHPLLDAGLLDFVLRIPPELSFDPNRGRPMLRASVEGLVPHAVRLRARKSYFDAPFYEALAGPDREPIRRVVLDPAAEVGAFVDLQRVREDLLDVPPTQHPRGVRFWMASTWRLVSAELWLRSQADPALPERALETWGLSEARYELTVPT
jgi:asparagine synthase (glutamine-hydrolysing)